MKSKIVVAAHFNPAQNNWHGFAVEMGKPGTHGRYDVIYNGGCAHEYWETEEAAKGAAMVAVSNREVEGEAPDLRPNRKEQFFLWVFVFLFWATVIAVVCGCSKPKDQGPDEDSAHIFTSVEFSSVRGYKFVYGMRGAVVYMPDGSQGRNRATVYSNISYELNKYYIIPLDQYDSIVKP